MKSYDNKSLESRLAALFRNSKPSALAHQRTVSGHVEKPFPPSRKGTSQYLEITIMELSGVSKNSRFGNMLKCKFRL